jgi:serine protease Do
MSAPSQSNSVLRAALCAIPFIVAAALHSAAAQGPVVNDRESQPTATFDAVPISRKLLESTVTVRITAPKSTAAAQQALAGGGGVTVCSGVSLGNGKVVTFAPAASESRFRVTLPGGEQSAARTAVLDEYSGLVLLEILRRDQPGLQSAKALPPVGSAVLTASAAGIELPVVSQGILGGIDRAIPGSGLPPLLQCDVRTTDSSNGAPIVDREGRLIGVVAATSAAVELGGWTYAVPMQHPIARMLQAWADAGGDRAQLPIVIKRRRPTLGLTMGPGDKEGTVRVERVERGGPAAKARIGVGNLILEVDGRRIRSAYQAVDLILKKQPGDPVELVVDQGAGPARIGLVLGGAQAIGPAVVAKDSPQVGPQLNVRALSRNQLEVRQGGRVAELTVDPSAAGAAGSAAIGRDEIGLLKAQLAAFEKVIDRLQQEVDRRDENRAKTDALIKSLTEEVSELRKQLEAVKK